MFVRLDGWWGSAPKTQGAAALYRGIEVPGNPKESARRPRGRHHPKHQDQMSRSGTRTSREAPATSERP